MGLFSGGNSATSSTSVVDTTNAGQSDINGIAASGKGNTITTVDAGALEAATRIAEAALASSDKTTGDALASITDIKAESFNAARSDSAGVAKEFFKYGAIALVGWALVRRFS